jgi:hypothetical protein
MMILIESIRLTAMSSSRQRGHGRELWKGCDSAVLQRERALHEISRLLGGMYISVTTLSSELLDTHRNTSWESTFGSS